MPSTFGQLADMLLQDILPDVEKFVCTLYGKKDSAAVNGAKYNLFSNNMPI